MFPKRSIPLLIIALLLGITVIVTIPLDNAPHTTTISYAQEGEASACDATVAQALELVADTCIGIGRNEVCYGNDFIAATLNDDNLFFDRPGDIVPVESIVEMNTGSADPDGNSWGVALMDVQADLPNSTEGVRILVFGGAQLEPDTIGTSELETCTFTNTAPSNLNMRSGPGTGFRVFDVLGFGEDVQVYGQTSDGEWLRSSRGWVSSEFGDLSCGVNTLQVMNDNDDSFVAPMQSFNLQVDDNANCEAVPTGMLIQSPEGQTANLRINNIEMRVGSSILVTVDEEAGCQRTINLDGNVGNGSLSVPEGASTASSVNGNDCAEDGLILPANEEDLAFVQELTEDFEDEGFYYETGDNTFVPTAPSLTASLSDDEIVEGQCTYLVWESEDAQNVTLNGVDDAFDNTLQLCPPETTTYTLVATPITDDFDAVSAALTVTVIAEEESDVEATAPTITAVAETDTILEGECVDITYSSTAAAVVTIGSKAQAITSGTAELCPTLTTTYRFTAMPEFTGFDAVSTLVEITVEPLPVEDATLEPDEPIVLPTIALCSDGTQYDAVGDPCNHDEDGDGIDDTTDLCPTYFNDTIGDPCNPDEDGDTTLDNDDNCPFISNDDQADFDIDGIGDACDDPLDDLGVSVTVSNASPAPNTTVTFTITVTNNGPTTLSADLTYSVIAATACPTQPSPGFAPVMVRINNLASLTSQSFTESYGSSALCAMTLDASLSAITPLDVEGDNNYAVASYSTTPVPAPDLATVVTSTNPNPAYGDPPFTVNYSVTNVGDVTAINAFIDLSYSGLILCSNGLPAALSPSATLTTLNPGQAYSGSITVDPSVHCSYTFTVAASLTGEPNTANNIASFSYSNPLPAPDLQVSGSLSPASPVFGDVIVITLTVTNIGNATANNVDVSLGRTQTICAGPGSGPSAFDVIPALAPGASQTYTETFDTMAGNICTGSAQASATVGGPPSETNTGNNSATQTFDVTP